MMSIMSETCTINLFSRSIIDNTRSVTDDSRVWLQLVVSFTIIIFLIIQATDLVSDITLFWVL